MKFIGVDLSWGLKRPSSLCVVRKTGQGFCYETLVRLVSLRDFAAFFRREKEPLCLAVDAPLVVKNERGNRQAEREISALLRQFRGGILPINLTIVEKRYPRLPLFWNLLHDHGFTMQSPFTHSFFRLAFEVFPPLIVLGLWGREALSTYWREKRSLLSFPAFGKTLSTLGSSDFSPPLLGLEQFFRDAWSVPSFLVDSCDALLCVYAACFLWSWGKERALCFGNPGEGEVVMPLRCPEDFGEFG